MVKQAVVRTADLEPIDRLEEKIKLLVEMVTRLRAEQAKAAEENARLVTGSGVAARAPGRRDRRSAELAALREERERSVPGLRNARAAGVPLNRSSALRCADLRSQVVTIPTTD